MAFYLFIFILGLAGLIIGSDLLVRKSEFVATHFKIQPVVVGILLLGMGTSAPEWAVSTLSSFRGLPDLAIGNVIGSNIFNILIVLSLILFRPLATSSRQLIRKDLLFLIITSFCLIPILMDQHLSRWDGLILVTIFLAYVVICLYYSSSISENIAKTTILNKVSLLQAAVLIVLGFTLLIGGSYITVYAAEYIGRLLGVSNRVMGILVVSVGTSLPEFFTCFASLLKGHKNMAIGNIIGSNVFNTYAVLSTSSLILPSQIVPQVITFDVPVMLLIYLLLLVLVFNNVYRVLGKFLPFCFLSVYGFYITWLLFFGS